MKSSLNAPSFAYYIAYGQQKRIPGRLASHPTYNLLGIPVDNSIPKLAMVKLMLLGDIDSRASCQGEVDVYPTFFIFRPILQSESICKDIVTYMRSAGFKSDYDKGILNQYRVCVTGDMVYNGHNKYEFQKWWNHLADSLYSFFDKIFGSTNVPLYFTSSNTEIISLYGLVPSKQLYDLNKNISKQLRNKKLTSYVTTYAGSKLYNTYVTNNQNNWYFIYTNDIQFNKNKKFKLCSKVAYNITRQMIFKHIVKNLGKVCKVLFEGQVDNSKVHKTLTDTRPNVGDFYGQTENRYRRYKKRTP